jgi:hypothetical protein
MDPKMTKEILDDLIPSIEAVEAKSTAVLEFLKHEGVASEEKLAPYLEQAASASNVRWLAVRARVERLLSAAEKDSAEKRTDKKDKKPETALTTTSQSDSETENNSKSAGPGNPNESTDKNKNEETIRKDTESKSNAAANDSKGNANDGDRPEDVKGESKPAVTGEEKKAA